VPYNHSRVVLETVFDTESDYINANYIDGYNRPKAYIASQGCNRWTIQDMWRMVWQINCCRIVMVTNLVEKGKVKCDLYWPDTEGEEKTFSDIAVTLMDVERTADFLVRSFRVVHSGETRQVKHFHFTAWPDHGVPNRTAPIIEFRRKVRSHDDTHPGPIIVHCSAGVGRTGAFIAIDSLLDQAKAENKVDVYNFTCNMRKDRANMIQTVEQYIFVYNALLEALKAGNTVIACSNFKFEHERLCHIDPTKGKSGLLEQFETLQTMLPNDKSDDYVQGNTPENQQKNRFSYIIPAERHRPYLMTRVQGTNDYINAVFLDGYRNRNAYIITQMPLPHTVIDLWRMVYEHNSGTIVMLNPWDDEDETYGQYWPEENEECECGPFIIEAMSVDRQAPDITVRELKLTYNPQSPILKKKEEAPLTVNQFQYHAWNKDAVIPSARGSLMTLLEMVERSQFKTGNHAVVIHCMDGVTASGLYVTISCVWERLKDEHEVDIFQAVKQLRYHRPQIIKNMEQYRFCHELVQSYLDEFATYANFK
jgi:protein tyrosine phosphatase